MITTRLDELPANRRKTTRTRAWIAWTAAALALSSNVLGWILIVIPSARSGTGLQGMTDRLDAVDGTITVHSQLGTGTKVSGSIPVPSDATGPQS